MHQTTSDVQHFILITAFLEKPTTAFLGRKRNKEYDILDRVPLAHGPF
jgi:hypothetical protein